MTPHRDRGIIDKPSNHSVDETVEKLKGILQARGHSLPPELLQNIGVVETLATKAAE